MNWFKKASGIRLWLDDERDPRDPFIQQQFGARGDEEWVRTAPEAIQILNMGNVSYISLDHDLGESGGSGYDVASFIEKNAYDGIINRMEWQVHSANPVGAKRIQQAMQNADKFWNRNELV